MELSLCQGWRRAEWKLTRSQLKWLEQWKAGDTAQSNDKDEPAAILEIIILTAADGRDTNRLSNLLSQANRRFHDRRVSYSTFTWILRLYDFSLFCEDGWTWAAAARKSKEIYITISSSLIREEITLELEHVLILMSQSRAHVIQFVKEISRAIVIKEMLVAKLIQEWNRSSNGFHTFSLLFHPDEC